MDVYAKQDVPENGEVSRSTRNGKRLSREERMEKYLALRGLVKGVTIEELIDSIHEGRRY